MRLYVWSVTTYDVVDCITHGLVEYMLQHISVRSVTTYGVVVITTAQLNSTKPELRFCADSNRACSMLEVQDDEDLWQWLQLEIRLNTFRWLTIPQKQFNSSPLFTTLQKAWYDWNFIYKSPNIYLLKITYLLPFSLMLISCLKNYLFKGQGLRNHGFSSA